MNNGMKQNIRLSQIEPLEWIWNFDITSIQHKKPCSSIMSLKPNESLLEWLKSFFYQEPTLSKAVLLHVHFALLYDYSGMSQVWANILEATGSM